MTLETKKSTFVIARRKVLKGIAMLTAVMLLGGPAIGSKAEAATTLRIAIPDPIGSSVGRAATDFAKYVSEETGGEVKLQVFADGILFGKDQNAAINQLGNGALDALILASSVYASFEPRMNAISLPYLFKDYDQLRGYLGGEPGATLLTSLERLNIVGLGIFLRTFRDVTTIETPITKASDFKDVTLRTPNNPLWVRLFQTLGANPTPMAFSEVYSALQLKAIDGQENPVEVPFNNKFYEVQGHLNITQHLADSFLLAMSEKAWNKIPAKHHDAIRTAAAKMVKQHDDEEIAQEAEIIEKLKARGMQVNRFEPGELEKVQELARTIYPEFEAKIGAEFMQYSIDFLKN